MAATIEATTVVHTPTGPIWLTAGSVVPVELVGFVGDHLLTGSPELETATKPDDEENADTVGIDEEGSNEDPDSTGDEADDEDSDSDSDSASEENADTGVPYSSYPLEDWATYATSLGVDVEGLKKVQVIHAVAAHFNISIDGLRPTEIVDKIREAAN